MNIFHNKKLISIFLIFQFSLIVASFTGGMLVQSLWVSSPGEFSLLKEAHQILAEQFLFELPSADKLEYGMIRGMIGALNDPHTNFFEPPQTELQHQQLAGQYGGIGAQIEVSQDGSFLLYPFPNSPARLAGIQDGDRLVSIDGWEIPPEATLDEVEAAIRGEVGQRVSLRILRRDESTLRTFTMRREEIAIPSITWNLTEENETVGIVRIHIITSATADEIQNAFQDLQARGASAFILDLRNNAGGLVTEGVEVARLFLQSGTVIEQQYQGQPVRTYRVERTGALHDVPLIVIVNSKTASAAEIIAGALQAQQRALLLGDATYGKDTIQLVFELKDKSSLHVTAARWWIPGRKEQSGNARLQPDILFPVDERTSSEVNLEAIKILAQN